MVSDQLAGGARALQRKARKAALSLRYNPRVHLESAGRLERLGTGYGGWVFQPVPDLEGSTIISAGLGEDGSFDVEFAARFGARVIVVDPTPRAIEHFKSIERRIGQRAQRAYTSDGRIPSEAYDLHELRPGQLELLPKALSPHPGPVRFFAPPDPAHVSHSIINFQNGYAEDTPFVMVETVSMRDVWNKAGGDVPLIKLDIEGAEIEVIEEMAENSLVPGQLLVEFDELNFPSRRSMARYMHADGHLRRMGLRPVQREGRANFLYVRRDHLTA